MGEVLHWPRRPADAPEQTATSSPVRTRQVQIPSDPEPLWREVVGRVLRETRQRREETLAEVAGRAGISVPYLSEIERGRKEPSSEVLAAVAGALQLRLVDLTAAVLRAITPLDLSSQHHGPVPRPSGPVALIA